METFPIKIVSSVYSLSIVGIRKIVVWLQRPLVLYIFLRGWSCKDTFQACGSQALIGEHPDLVGECPEIVGEAPAVLE